MMEFVEGAVLLDNDGAEVEKLVQGLFSLTEGELSAAALIGTGERAIPALRRFTRRQAEHSVSATAAGGTCPR